MYWEATYWVTTPLFLGGANSAEIAELRPSTLKGLLRFWFRAIALPQLQALDKVKHLESHIFGSTKRQSSFLLHIFKQEGLSKINPGEDWRNHYGLRYLGYGVTDRNGNTTRPYLKHNGSFSIRLMLKKDAPQETAFFLPLTLQALGLFGAAGARSRKGFGSLSLKSLTFEGAEIWKAPETVEELKECQNTLLSKIRISESSESLPEYTAFSKNSYIWVVRTGTDALELLNDLGYEMLRFRSYGREEGGKHLLPDRRSEAEQIFADDHDLILAFCRGKQIKTHPRRVVFGMPHNYYFISTRDRVNISPSGKDRNRRASPLFIHIHDLGPNGYAAVLTLLPAAFLPSEEKITISAGSRRRVTVDCAVDYRIIHDFLNRPAFSQSKVVVWP